MDIFFKNMFQSRESKLFLPVIIPVPTRTPFAERRDITSASLKTPPPSSSPSQQRQNSLLPLINTAKRQAMRHPLEQQSKITSFSPPATPQPSRKRNFDSADLEDDAKPVAATTVPTLFNTFPKSSERLTPTLTRFSAFNKSVDSPSVSKLAAPYYASKRYEGLLQQNVAAREAARTKFPPLKPLPPLPLKPYIHSHAQLPSQSPRRDGIKLDYSYVVPSSSVKSVSLSGQQEFVFESSPIVPYGGVKKALEKLMPGGRETPESSRQSSRSPSVRLCSGCGISIRSERGDRCDVCERLKSGGRDNGETVDATTTPQKKARPAAPMQEVFTVNDDVSHGLLRLIDWFVDRLICQLIDWLVDWWDFISFLDVANVSCCLCIDYYFPFLFLIICWGRFLHVVFRHGTVRCAEKATTPKAPHPAKAVDKPKKPPTQISPPSRRRCPLALEPQPSPTNSPPLSRPAAPTTTPHHRPLHHAAMNRPPNAPTSPPPMANHRPFPASPCRALPPRGPPEKLLSLWRPPWRHRRRRRVSSTSGARRRPRKTGPALGVCAATRTRWSSARPARRRNPARQWPRPRSRPRRRSPACRCSSLEGRRCQRRHLPPNYRRQRRLVARPRRGDSVLERPRLRRRRRPVLLLWRFPLARPPQRGRTVRLRWCSRALGRLKQMVRGSDFFFKGEKWEPLTATNHWRLRQNSGRVCGEGIFRRQYLWNVTLQMSTWSA